MENNCFKLTLHSNLYQKNASFPCNFSSKILPFWQAIGRSECFLRLNYSLRPTDRLAKSSECSSYPEIDFDNVPQYWSTKVLPKWTKFEEMIYKSSIILQNILFWEETSSLSSYLYLKCNKILCEENSLKGYFKSKWTR